MENGLFSGGTCFPLNLIRRILGKGAILLAILGLVSCSYVPAKIDTGALVKGDTSCRWGEKDCNRCVPNVVSQLENLKKSYKNTARIRFDGYAYDTTGYLLHRIEGKYEHIQSIGRIAGLGHQEYMVFTHSTDSEDDNKQGALAVIRMGANQYSRGGPLGHMPSGDGADQNTRNRTVAATYSGNNHPGGLSVMGKYVYVAQWCQPHGDGQHSLLLDYSRWCHAGSTDDHGLGFSVYDVSLVDRNQVINSNPPADVAYHHVWGEPWINNDSTSSIAASKLESGMYLIALGSSGGKKYGFYLASDPTGPFSFLNDINPVEKWSENSNLVTECGTGDMYLLLTEGSGDWDNVDKLHIYRLTQASGKIDIKYVDSHKFWCRGEERNGAGDWCHFDAGAGIYVTPDGDLILYATEWHQSSHGNVRIVEFLKKD